MKCEACNKHEASVQVKQVADGMVKEVYLCAGCAEKSGMKSPAAMADFLFGVGSLPSGSAPKTSKSCPGCHMRSSDFQKNSRLGCAQCYDTFSDELTPMVESMHRAQRHTGKAPAREAVRAEVDGLQAKLQHAVQQQDFESAAEIRDEIKALESHVS